MFLNEVTVDAVRRNKHQLKEIVFFFFLFAALIWECGICDNQVNSSTKPRPHYGMLTRAGGQSVF